MAQTLQTSPPLAAHFDPKPLRQIGFLGSQLLATTSHQPTELEKTGVAALLAKLPFSSDEPVPMDIDVACGLYDEKGTLLELVWYGNLRSSDQSVRHGGDTFIGMNAAYRPSLVEEHLFVRFYELPKEVHRLGIFVHSHSKADLNLAVAGKVSLTDNEGQLIHEIPFAALDDGITGICAWQLLRTFDDDFRLSALLEPIKGDSCEALAKKWSMSQPI